MDFSMSGFSVLHYLPEFGQIYISWVRDAIQRLILCHPLLLLSSIFPSIRVFSNESALRISWPKHRSFSFSITSPKLYVNVLNICKKKFFLRKKNSEWPQKTSKTYHYFIDGETEASGCEVISPKIADSAKGRVRLANAHRTTLALISHETVIHWLSGIDSLL